MGINLEYITLLSSLEAREQLPKQGKVIEFGAQDISAEPEAAGKHAQRCGMKHSCSRIDSARMLYDLYGLHDYTCIDATAEHGALVFDLNNNLRSTYGFSDTFDLVTDLGTFEHVFDVASAFRNAHEVCKLEGLMIHALPSNCNANHGYYTMQPRMIADIAAANGYEIVDLVFTVDYKPVLYRFDSENYRDYDDRDLMIYSVLRKKTDTPFHLPFDSIFTDKNTLTNYQPLLAPLAFSSYIKGTWNNVRPKAIEEVPTNVLALTPRCRSWIKRIINRLGVLC